MSFSFRHFVAPRTMRVAVLVFMMPQQRAAIAKQLDDNRIRGEYVLAFVFRQALEIDSAIIDWRINPQAIFLAGIEIVGAMTGRGVYDAAALIERYVISKDSRHLNRQKGMLKFHSGKVGALEFSANASFLNPAFGL